nr:unnamed protein product [Naegleria fowleri]
MLFTIALPVVVFLFLVVSLSSKWVRYRHDILPNRKCVIVSGAASGIGEALVRQLLSHHCRVIAVDCNEPLLSQRRQEYIKMGLLRNSIEDNDHNNNNHSKEVSGATYETHSFDLSSVTSQDIQQQLFSEGSVDSVFALVNCAGISYPRDTNYTSLVELNEEVVDKMLKTNVTSHMKMTRAVFPHLSRSEGRSKALIMNVASPAGVLIPPFLGTPYGVTKAALIGWNDGIRRELRSSGIDVCCVFPGFTKTGMAFKGSIDPQSEFSQEIANCQHSFGKIMDTFGQDPNEVAQVMFSNLFSSNRGKHVYVDSNGKNLVWPFLAAIQSLCPSVIDWLLLKLTCLK